MANQGLRLIFGALALLSQAPEAGAAPHGAAYTAAVAEAGDRLDPGHRYLETCIDNSEAYFTFPTYGMLRIKGCAYEHDSGLKGFVYTLDPSLGQLATWIDHACAQFPRLDQAKCGKAAFWGIYNSNNAQFPVAGNVIEGAAGCGATGAGGFNIQFRDGVAVMLKGATLFCPPGQQPLDQQKLDALEPIEKAYFVARVAVLDPHQYEVVTLKTIARSSIKHNSGRYHPTTAWLDLSRDSFVRAYTSDSYEFLDLKVKYCVEHEDDALDCLDPPPFPCNLLGTLEAKIIFSSEIQRSKPKDDTQHCTYTAKGIGDVLRVEVLKYPDAAAEFARQLAGIKHYETLVGTAAEQAVFLRVGVGWQTLALVRNKIVGITYVPEDNKQATKKASKLILSRVIWY